MEIEESVKKKQLFAQAIIIIEAVLLFLLSLPFLAGISLGIVFYVILDPLYKKMIPMLKNKSFVAIILIIFSFFVLVLPLSYAGYLIVIQIIKALKSPEIASLFNSLSLSFKNIEIGEFLQTHLATIVNYLQTFSISALESTTFALINLFIMYIILFFLFLRGDTVHEFLIKIIPFKSENSQKFIEDERKLIKSTIVSNLIVALVMGILFTIGLYIIGYKDIIFWFSLSAILSFIPVVGIPIIWIPLGVYLLLNQKYSAGIGIIAWGSFLSFLLDGYIRQFAQNWFGKIDPFISIAGIVIGVFFFGLVGIVVGPFLVSMLVETYKIYQKEYGGMYK